MAIWPCEGRYRAGIGCSITLVRRCSVIVKQEAAVFVVPYAAAVIATTMSLRPGTTPVILPRPLVNRFHLHPIESPSRSHASHRLSVWCPVPPVMLFDKPGGVTGWGGEDRDARQEPEQRISAASRKIHRTPGTVVDCKKCAAVSTDHRGGFRDDTISF